MSDAGLSLANLLTADEISQPQTLATHVSSSHMQLATSSLHNEMRWSRGHEYRSGGGRMAECTRAMLRTNIT